MNILTPTDFLQLVQDMREAQKSYFSTRSKAALVRSKELEKKVDELIQNYHTTILNV